MACLVHLCHVTAFAMAFLGCGHLARTEQTLLWLSAPFLEWEKWRDECFFLLHMFFHVSPSSLRRANGSSWQNVRGLTHMRCMTHKPGQSSNAATAPHHFKTKRNVERAFLFLLYAAVVSAKTLAPCKFIDSFQDVRGKWIKTRDLETIGGYDEEICPDFVHVTDCLRQSRDVPKTLAEYRYVTRSSSQAHQGYNQAKKIIKTRPLIDRACCFMHSKAHDLFSEANLLALIHDRLLKHALPIPSLCRATVI